VATGLLGNAIPVTCVVAGRTVLLMGVRAGGEVVRIVLLRLCGLDVITRYGEICLGGLGEILSKDFC